MTYELNGINYGMIGRYERCPICHELLWEEWGYFSYEECLFWDYYLYKVIDFPIDHRRWCSDDPYFPDRNKDDLDVDCECIEEVD